MTVVAETPKVSPLTPVRTGRNLQLMLLVTLAADLVVLSSATLLAWRLRAVVDVWSPSVGPLDHLVGRTWALLVLVWLLVLAAHGGYNRRHVGAGPDEFRAVASASVVTAGLVGLYCYLFDLPLSRGFVIFSFAIGTPLLLVERYASRAMLHRARVAGRLMHRVVAIGGPSSIKEIVQALRSNKHVGYQVVGACVPDGVTTEDLPVPMLGRPSDIRGLCREVGGDTVLVARGAYDSSHELRRVAWELEGSDIDLVVVPSLTDVAGPRIHMRPVGGVPLLHVEEPQAGAAGGLAKRVFDVTLAAVVLVLLSPVLLAVAALVSWQDGGPVLFRQDRVGRDGKHFDMLKFRSMNVDAESQLDALVASNDLDGVLFKMRNDPRVTRIGRVLRRYSLDELPQLINVLRGDMSLVGPRPPLPSEVAKYGIDVHRRLLVRPGLTGLWQVSGRSGLSWDESVRLDLYYVDNWSLTADLVIMAKTARAVLGKTGAY